MSTDHPSSRRFATTVVGTVAALLIVCLALAGFAFVQGQTIRIDTPHPEQLVTQPNQQIVITSNQPFEQITADDVEVSPPAPITVSSSVNRAIISFDQLLANDTDYEVRISGLPRTARTEADGGLVERFRTPPATFYSLTRDPTGLDRIESGSLEDNGRTTVFEADRIRDFAPVDGGVVVNLYETDDENRLIRVDGATGRTHEIDSPGVGYISQLDSSPAHDLVGFRFSGTTATGDYLDNVLFTVDGAGPAVSERSLDGSPLQVVEWGFVPGNPAYVAQDYDTNTVLVDTREEGAIFPLGQYSELEYFSGDGTAVVVGDGDALSTIYLSNGAAAPITFDAVDGVEPYPSTAVPLGRDGTLLVYWLVDPATGIFSQHVVVESDAGRRELFQPGDDGLTVQAVSVSPNGQYLALETVPSEGSASDGYSDDAQATDVGVVLLDLETAERIDSFPGFGFHWHP